MADNKNALNVVIMIFIFLIIAVTLISVLGDSNASLSKIDTVVNESFTGIVGTPVALTNDNFQTVSAVINSTGATLTVTTDYLVNAADGTINITVAGNNTDGSTTYAANYTFFTDTFVADSTTRTIVNLTLIFFAIFILGGAVFFAVKGLEDAGFKM